MRCAAKANRTRSCSVCEGELRKAILAGDPRRSRPWARVPFAQLGRPTSLTTAAYTRSSTTGDQIDRRANRRQLRYLKNLAFHYRRREFQYLETLAIDLLQCCLARPQKEEMHLPTDRQGLG